MQIEEDVPIPTIRREGRPRTEASKAAKQLKPGQSVLCDTLREYENVRAYIRRAGGRSCTRKMPDGSGWRVWRVE